LDYKKKTVKRTVPKKRKTQQPKSIDKIDMKPAKRKGERVEPVKSETKIKVIKGRKKERERNRIISLAVTAVLLTAVIVFSAITPTGPFEYLQNLFSSFGVGEFPADISGSRFLDAYTEGNLFYTLTDTHAEIVNKSGKTIFSRQHEFNSPALCVSPQRSLIFDRGGRSAFVFNNNDVLHSLTTENEMYCADIGRNGTFAIATKSDGYASQVEVFGKNRKSKFIWYSSNDLINNVLVSDNGRMIAVATLNVSSGKYVSKLRVFNFSSAEPIYTVEYDDSLIYSLECVSGSSFAVSHNKGIDVIKWKKGTKTELASEYSLEFLRLKKGSWILKVCGNKSGSVISVYNKKGEVLGQFEFAADITDITYRDETVCILSDGYLYFYGLDGKELGNKINLSGFDRIFTLSDDSVIASGNFGIDKFKIEKGE